MNVLGIIPHRCSILYLGSSSPMVSDVISIMSLLVLSRSMIRKMSIFFIKPVELCRLGDSSFFYYYCRFFVFMLILKYS